jgi:outer membrane protein assembly factor BamB
MLYDGGTTAVVHGKRVVGTTAIAVKTGCTFAKRWFEAAGAGTEPQPLVAGGLVFTAGGDTGGFSAYRAGTGVAVWHYPTGSPAVSPLILAGSEVVGGDDGGDVYAFSAT